MFCRNTVLTLIQSRLLIVWFTTHVIFHRIVESIQILNGVLHVVLRILMLMVNSVGAVAVMFDMRPMKLVMLRHLLLPSSGLDDLIVNTGMDLFLELLRIFT